MTAVTVKSPCGCLYNMQTHKVFASASCLKHRPVSTSRWISSLTRPWVERSIEAKLMNHLNAARVHDNNGVPYGHLYYRLLYQEGWNLLEAFAKEHMLSGTGLQEEQALELKKAMSLLFAKYPAMAELQKLQTQPTPAEASAVPGPNLVEQICQTFVQVAAMTVFRSAIGIGVVYLIVQLIRKLCHI